LPFVFGDHVAGFVCSDFLPVDAVAIEDLDHLPDAGDVFGGRSLEPTDAETKLVTPKEVGFSRFSLNYARSSFFLKNLHRFSETP
jgi:hypothetical protein